MLCGKTTIFFTTFAQLDLFNTVFHLLVKNINKGEARGGGRLKIERELISFLPLKRGGGGCLFEGVGLKGDLR